MTNNFTFRSVNDYTNSIVPAASSSMKSAATVDGSPPIVTSSNYPKTTLLWSA